VFGSNGSEEDNTEAASIRDSGSSAKIVGAGSPQTKLRSKLCLEENSSLHSSTTTVHNKNFHTAAPDSSKAALTVSRMTPGKTKQLHVVTGDEQSKTTQLQHYNRTTVNWFTEGSSKHTRHSSTVSTQSSCSSHWDLQEFHTPADGSVAANLPSPTTKVTSPDPLRFKIKNSHQQSTPSTKDSPPSSKTSPRAVQSPVSVKRVIKIVRQNSGTKKLGTAVRFHSPAKRVDLTPSSPKNRLTAQSPLKGLAATALTSLSSTPSNSSCNNVSVSSNSSLSPLPNCIEMQPVVRSTSTQFTISEDDVVDPLNISAAISRVATTSQREVTSPEKATLKALFSISSMPQLESDSSPQLLSPPSSPTSTPESSPSPSPLQAVPYTTSTPNSTVFLRSLNELSLTTPEKAGLNGLVGFFNQSKPVATSCSIDETAPLTLGKKMVARPLDLSQFDTSKESGVSASENQLETRKQLFVQKLPTKTPDQVNKPPDLAPPSPPSIVPPPFAPEEDFTSRMPTPVLCRPTKLDTSDKPARLHFPSQAHCEDKSVSESNAVNHAPIVMTTSWQPTPSKLLSPASCAIEPSPSPELTVILGAGTTGTAASSTITPNKVQFAKSSPSPSSGDSFFKVESESEDNYVKDFQISRDCHVRMGSKDFGEVCKPKTKPSIRLQSGPEARQLEADKSRKYAEQERRKEEERKVQKRKRKLEEERSRKDGEERRKRDVEEKKKREDEERLRKADEERRMQEQEKKRKAEERRRKVEEERKRKEDERQRKFEEARRKKEEQNRKKQEKERELKAEEERKQKEEKERKRKMEEEKRKKEQERKRQVEEDKRKKGEKELQRKLEEEAKKDEEKRRRQEREQLRHLEAEKKRKAEQEKKRQVLMLKKLKEEKQEEEKRQAQEEKKRKAEERRRVEQEKKQKAEERRIAEEEARKRKAEEQRIAEEEKKRKEEEEQREKAEAERKWREEVTKRMAQEEKERQAEEERKAQQALEKRAEEERIRKVHEERTRKEAEERRIKEEEQSRQRQAEEEERERKEEEERKRRAEQVRIEEEETNRKAVQEEQDRQIAEQQERQRAQEQLNLTPVPALTALPPAETMFQPQQKEMPKRKPKRQVSFADQTDGAVQMVAVREYEIEEGKTMRKYINKKKEAITITIRPGDSIFVKQSNGQFPRMANIVKKVGEYFLVRYPDGTEDRVTSSKFIPIQLPEEFVNQEEECKESKLKAPNNKSKKDGNVSSANSTDSEGNDTGSHSSGSISNEMLDEHSQEELTFSPILSNASAGDDASGSAMNPRNSRLGGNAESTKSRKRSKFSMKKSSPKDEKGSLWDRIRGKGSKSSLEPRGKGKGGKEKNHQSVYGVQNKGSCPAPQSNSENIGPPDIDVSVLLK